MPQNIYDLIQQYIQSYTDDFYLRVDVEFHSGLGSIDQVYCIQVIKLKEMLQKI